MGEVTTKPRRILIVDDHEVIRAGIIRLFASHTGIEICGEASNVEQTLQLVRQHRPDLAIVDISLLDGNGLELTTEIRRISPESKVVMYSFHDELLYADRSLRCGASAYVQKQEPAQCLVTAVMTVLSGRIYLSDTMTERLIIRAAQVESDGQKSWLESLSDRELEVFEWLGHGLTSAEIARQMNLKQKTVETYREKIKRKLGLLNGNQLIQHAVKWVLEHDRS